MKIEFSHFVATIDIAQVSPGSYIHFPFKMVGQKGPGDRVHIGILQLDKVEEIYTSIIAMIKKEKFSTVYFSINFNAIEGFIETPFICCHCLRMDRSLPPNESYRTVLVPYNHTTGEKLPPIKSPAHPAIMLMNKQFLGFMKGLVNISMN